MRFVGRRLTVLAARTAHRDGDVDGRHSRRPAVATAAGYRAGRSFGIAKARGAVARDVAAHLPERFANRTPYGESVNDLSKEDLVKPFAIVVSLGMMVLPDVTRAQNPQMLPPAVITDTAINSVTVQNHRKVPVTIYLASGTFDRRLGVVPPDDTKTLPLPAWAANGFTTVRLFAHPENEVEDLGTERFALRPPGRVRMLVRSREEMLAAAPRDTMTESIPPEELANATLTVDNPRDVPVTVYAAAGMFDVRLGEVPAKQRVTLRFPKSVVSPFNSIAIIVHPQNGSDLGTQTMKVHPGEHLGLHVPPA